MNPARCPTIEGMDSADLSRDQIEAVEAKVRPMLAWLTKLADRMAATTGRRSSIRTGDRGGEAI